ncbi:hypothetical protein [Spartinivicinus ruber]|uniref:hypothetical protein n=1 Tax=Spartinivicinus ruber TaxID=2683272 RepID=UPI0013D5E8D0|nr:hypothetical protein [Spartinivicinus ruber]
MLKFRLMLITVATFMSLLGPSAHAFSKACVYLQPGSMYAARIQVVSENWRSKWSNQFAIGQSQCISLEALKPGTYFTVQISAAPDHSKVLCAPNRINNVETPVSAMFLASGTALGIKCSNPHALVKNAPQQPLSLSNSNLTPEEIIQFNQLIDAPETNTELSSVEKKMLDTAKKYLAGELSKKKALESLISMEIQTLKFALDADQVQILRETDDDYVRFGFLRGSDSLELIGQPSAFVKLNHKEAAPNSSALADSLHAEGMPVVAILGKARIGSPRDVREAIKTASKAMDRVYLDREVAFITGGYKGALDDVYGYTRIGYERAKDLEAYTLVVVPEAGTKDSHNYVDAKDIFGKMWGDDTPALVGVADAAMVFAWYGSWTKIEIDTLLHQKKKVVIVNPFQKEGDEVVEVKMKKGIVKSYRDPEVAAKALIKMLPTEDELKESAPKDVEKLPYRDNALSEIEYYPLPRWSKESGERTATSMICQGKVPCEPLLPNF